MTAVVLGLGALTSIGLNAPSTAAAQRAGVAGHAAHPFMVDRTGEPMFVDRVPWGETDDDGVARMVELALPAVREAVAHFANERPIDILLGLPEVRPGLPDDFAATVLWQMVEGLASDIAIGRRKAVPAGHSAGVACLRQAAALLAREQDALVVVGGVDTWLVPETLEWLDSLELLHSTAMPWGLCPGEAAAFCLLGGEHRGGRLTVAAGGEAVEPNHIRTETVCIGAGMTEAWRSALRPLSGTDHRVDRIWCDLNGEPYRADEIAFAVLRSREVLSDDVDLVTPADCWGDVGAATGPLMAIAATQAAVKQYAPGPLSLLSASSEGGARAAVLLHDRGWADRSR